MWPADADCRPMPPTGPRARSRFEATMLHSQSNCFSDWPSLDKYDGEAGVSQPDRPMFPARTCQDHIGQHSGLQNQFNCMTTSWCPTEIPVRSRRTRSERRVQRTRRSREEITAAIQLLRAKPSALTIAEMHFPETCDPAASSSAPPAAGQQWSSLLQVPHTALHRRCRGLRRHR